MAIRRSWEAAFSWEVRDGASTRWTQPPVVFIGPSRPIQAFGQRFRSDLGVARILTQPTSAIWLQTCTPWTATGKLLWKTNLDKHRGARITGSRRLYEGRLYVPVASLEEASAGVPDYECCTFRSSFPVAVHGVHVCNQIAEV